MVRKKGVFFTFTAILMMGVFLLSFFVYHEYKMRNRALVIETRIMSINDFISDIRGDTERGLYISSFRSILALLESVGVNQSYIDDVDLRFYEAFFNGTIKGNEMLLVKNNTFTDWENKITGEAAKTDIELYFQNKSLMMWQDEPWSVNVRLNFTLGIGDLKGTAYWVRDMQVETRISIISFEDPIYRIETNGLVLNAIRKKNVSFFVNQSDVSNLKQHLDESRYVAWTKAPSFLKRLEGDLSADENGIESLVSLDELDSQGLSTEQKSVVDYIYFSSSDPAWYRVKGMPGWFRLDNESNSEGNQTHLQLYEVNEITK